MRAVDTGPDNAGVVSADSDDVLDQIDAAIALGVVSADPGVSADAMRWTAGPVATRGTVTIRCPEPVFTVDPALAAEALIDVPVALSMGAFDLCVASDHPEPPGLLPGETGRLRDLLHAYLLAGGPGGGERVLFTHYRVFRADAGPEPIPLVAVRPDGAGVTICRAT